MASEIQISSDLTHDCEAKNDSLKAAATLDKLMLNVTPKLVTQASVNEDSTDRSNTTTYVTIHLPDGMQGSTLSQQKLQELILHLSQSGQIQLREDSKIVIDLKFTGKSNTQSAVTKLEAPTLQSQSLSSSVSQVSSGLSATPRVVHLGNLNCAAPFKIEMPSTDNVQVVRTVPSLGSSSNHVLTIPNVTQPTASQHMQSRQIQQQPTYILVPATQLAGGSDNQVYSNTQQVRPTSTCPTIMRTSGLALGGNTISNANSLTFGSNDRSFILLQQPLGGSNLPIGSHNSVVAGSNTASGTIVPLRHLTGGNASGLVPGNTTLMAGTPNRLSASNVDLFNNTSSIGSRASQNTPSSVGLVALTGGGSGISSNSTQRESTWQQYVKQFTKLGPCPICGDKISGYHYGIFCCESCKGFFKRTVQNAKRYACHRPNASSLCDINVASRKKCPACRFIKCVDKGMRIEVSDDPEQLSCSVVGLAGAHHTLGPDGLPATDDAGGGVYLDPGVLGTHDHDDEEEDVDGNSMRVEQSILDYGIIDGTGVSSTPYVRKQVSGSGDPAARTREQLPKIIRDILLVEETIEAEPEDSLEIETGIVPPGAVVPEGVSEDEAAVYRALLNLADQRLYRTVRWSRALPDFAQLDTDDQILLIQNCWADLLCLDCCWRSLPTPTEIRLTSSKCINLEAAREMGAEDIVERMLQLTQSLTRLHLDVIEYACLKVIVLMQPDLKNLKATKQVKDYQDSVNRLLLDYVLKSSPDVKDKYSKLLQRIPELRKTSQAARLMLVDLDLSAYLSTNSLLMELLRSDIQRFAPSQLAGTTTTTPVTPGVNTTSSSAVSTMTKTVSITMATDSNHDGEANSNNQDYKLPHADSFMESGELASMSHLSNTTATNNTTTTAAAADDDITESEENEASTALANMDIDKTHSSAIIASSE